MSTITYAKVLGLFGSGLLTGGTLCISAFAVPALDLTATPSVIIQRQWAALYNSSKAWFPPTAILTSAAFAEVAWLTHQAGGAWKPWAVSATATVAVIPYTLAFMMGNIRQLQRCQGKENNEDLPGLVVKWAWLNMVKTGMHVIAFGTALWTVVYD